MIRVRHNGRERSVAREEHASLGDAVASCLAGPEGQGEILERLCVNGVVLEDPDVAALRHLALADDDAIEIESRPARRVAAAGLESAAAYLPNVASSARRTALLLRGGEIQRANGLYAHLLDALAVLAFLLRAAAREVGPAGEGLSEVEAESGAVLTRLLVAQQRQDWIAVADGLEHEVSPLLGRWSEGVARARASIAGEAEVDASC